MTSADPPPGAAPLPAFVMLATPFTAAGELDEAALHVQIARMAAEGIGLYLGSGGAGEGHALSDAELLRLYQIGVEAGAGKIPVHANIPERHTALASIEQARLAMAAGVENIHLYPPEGRHGMRPTDAEILAYFDDVLAVVQQPVTLGCNPVMGYGLKVAVVAEICRRHQQVVSLRISGVSEGYHVAVRQAVRADMTFYVRLDGSLNHLVRGRTGVYGIKANILPRTFADYGRAFARGDMAGLARAYGDLTRFADYAFGWTLPGAPRWLKAALRVLDLPGGAGGLRRPYLMPSDSELAGFADGLRRLDIPELTDLARNAGKRPPG